MMPVQPTPAPSPAPSPLPTQGPTSVTFTIASTFPVGSSVTGSWTKTSGASNLDWIALYPAGVTPNGNPPSTWYIYVTTGATSGTFDTSVNTYRPAFTMPATGGFVIYYLYADGYTQLGRTGTLYASTPAPAPVPTSAQLQAFLRAADR